MSEHWLSVDTDDRIHLPRNRGHPKRSAHPSPHWRTEGLPSSEALLKGMDRFAEWRLSSGHPVTLFVIAEQLDCPDFRSRLLDFSQQPGITISCHGWSHRCWSAWPADPEEFTTMLKEAKERIESVAGDSWRPWFRAPGGYVAPWMAAPLADAGFTLDSSVNPTPMLLRKSGVDSERNRSNGWQSVLDAMRIEGVVERPWLTVRAGIGPRLPGCGPALHIPGLATLARRAWRRTSLTPSAEDRTMTNPNRPVTVLYWHLLDHARRDGEWTPPVSPRL